MSFEVHSINQPLWLRSLVEDVIVGAVAPHGFIGPLGYRWWEPGDTANPFDGWQLAVYPTPNEVRGPVAHDGCKFVHGFKLDVTHIIGVMTSVESVVWNAPHRYNGDLDGPEVGVRGVFAGKRVWVRFFNMPPPDEPCYFTVDPTTGQTAEKTS